ncbi:hypothetical protein MKC97_19975 [[Clostridium] innocuum]|nr:hypothetical protein [[Clostridium] innocuum]
METILRAQSYLSNNDIQLITSLIDFEDKADDLINAHFRNNQDNETNENIDELFNELRDLFDDEYFDKSWEKELENYILQK